MDEDAMLKECLGYFEGKSVYEKLFKKMREKYVGLGRMGGTIVLGELGKEERNQLGGFFQRDFHKTKRVSITMHMLDQALMQSRFATLTWKEIVEAFDKESLIANHEVKTIEEQEKILFLEEIYEWYEEETTLLCWIKQLFEQHLAGYSMMIQQYKEDPRRLKTRLKILKCSAQSLPFKEGKTELFPVFSAKATGNPHYFDEGTLECKMLSLYLEFLFPEQKEDGLSEPERKKQLFFAAGLIKDEISNYCVAYGICARKKNGDMHEGIGGYTQTQEPVHVSLWTLGNIQSVCGKSSQNIYVLENPAVFSELIRKYPDITAICSNGQPRLATLLLLDLLSVEGSIYYAGDFDPEGLMIAQRLKDRYGSKLKFWQYDIAYYRTYLSTVTLSDTRLKKLQKVTDPQLLEIKLAVEKKKRATYQEAMIDVYERYFECLK